MYHPTTRVLTVLELLQAHRQMSGPRLAERLEVDVRSVRRYITMLQDLGIPIEAERGRYGNYRLMRGFKLPPLMLTEDEALALTLGLLAAKRLGLTMAAPAVEGALAKIDRVLPEALRDRVQAVQETLVLDSISTERYHSSPESTVVLTLSIATQQEKRIWMRYQSGQAEETERAVDSYGLIFHAGLWYTVGYCHLLCGKTCGRFAWIGCSRQSCLKKPSHARLALTVWIISGAPLRACQGPGRWRFCWR